MELFTKSILLKGLSEEETNELLEHSLPKFKAAFTTKEKDKNLNYEFFEKIGDLSINKFVVLYLCNKFPYLKSSEGVPILANAQNKYASKDFLSYMSEKYGFDKWVNCTEDEYLDKSRLKSILEDVFEAFFGAIEIALSEKYGYALPFAIIYRILNNLYNLEDITISYEDLVDAKTQLNELKDKAKLKVEYIDSKLPNNMFETKLYVNKVLAGIGVSNTKKQSNIIAAREALNWIKANLGITVTVPDRYKNISSFLW